MTQFIHEEDLSEAIALTLERKLRSVFNISGPGEVPLKVAIRETGGTALPLPEFVARALFGRLWPCTYLSQRSPVTLQADGTMASKATQSGARPARAATVPNTVI